MTQGPHQLWSHWDRIEQKLDKIADILAQQTIHENLLEAHSKTMDHVCQTLRTLSEKMDLQDKQVFMLTGTVKFYDGIVRWSSRGLIAAASAVVAYIAADMWERLSHYLFLIEGHVK